MRPSLSPTRRIGWPIARKTSVLTRWTVRSYVSWKFANSGEETLVHADLEFGTVEEAMRAGVEFAIKWIDEGKQDFLT
jgi:hypothetical protein